MYVGTKGVKRERIPFFPGFSKREREEKEDEEEEMAPKLFSKIYGALLVGFRWAKEKISSHR